MNIRVIHPEELTPSQIQLWTKMMTPSDATDSPFFHPDYVITLGRFRESVRVAIVTENDREVAFFPFEQHGKSGRPLGIKLCDFQGIVRAPGITLDARELLTECGLTRWHFDHVVMSQPEFSPWCFRIEDSPYADLSNGFDAYVAERKRAGNRSIAETLRKRRKFEREVGPLRFAWQSSDPAAFEALLEWKSAQRKQTGTFDVLQLEWVVKTLDALRNMQSENFGGVLSTLHVNDTLAAVSLCMRTQTVLHHWFPAYNTELSAYSPGLILHVAVLQAAAERGICRFDFGKGKDRYKDSFTSGSIPVGEGAVDLNPRRHMARNSWHQVCHQIRCSPLREPARVPKRLIKNLIQKREMRSS